MRIGIGARFLTHPQPGGFKTYTVNLLAALGQIDRDDQFFIYLDRRPTDNAVLPAAPEVVQDGALLVDSKDVDLWANAMRDVIASGDRRAALRERGLRRAALLSWNKCAEGTLAVYRSASLLPPVSLQPNVSSAIGS